MLKCTTISLNSVLLLLSSYIDIDSIKDVFETVFCKHAYIEDAIFWDVTCMPMGEVETSDMLTTLHSLTSQKLESSMSAPLEPNVTWLERVSSCNNARLSFGICNHLMLKIGLHSVVLQSQPLPWEPQISPRVLPFLQANARIKYHCMQ